MQKVAIITGASSGIGKSLAISFNKNGYHVVMGARNLDQMLSIAQTMQHGKQQVLCFPCDVSIETDCKALIDNTLKHFGRIDVLVCNAGITMRALFTEVDLQVVKQVMDVNFWGSVYCAKYALPHLIQQKGSLVGVSSIAGYVGLPGRTGYSSSKFALQGFLEVIRNENLKKGLHVLTVCPGFTQSNIRMRALTADGSIQAESPRKESKMMTSETVAEAILIGIKKRKREVILTTSGKFIVWLHKFFPAWADKIVYSQMAKEINAPIK